MPQPEEELHVASSCNRHGDSHTWPAIDAFLLCPRIFVTVLNMNPVYETCVVDGKQAF